MLLAAVWYVSPSLRATLGKSVTDYQRREVQDHPSAMWSRLEYWKKALRFIADAPLVGHGTGSTRGLFERAAVGQIGVRAEVVGDPHNQTLNVAAPAALMALLERIVAE